MFLVLVNSVLIEVRKPGTIRHSEDRYNESVHSHLCKRERRESKRQKEKRERARHE